MREAACMSLGRVCVCERRRPGVARVVAAHLGRGLRGGELGEAQRPGALAGDGQLDSRVVARGGDGEGVPVQQA